jgi:ParB family chromosome partitioning protein
MQDVSANIQRVELSLINVLNPRVRNPKVFKEIVDSIAAVGLKKPITLARRPDRLEKPFDLVCGQGRMEAFRFLGETSIPALVIDASPEECLLMSLAENVARRRWRSWEFVQELVALVRRPYSPETIAEKTGLSTDYVQGLVKLLERGEQRLIQSVEIGQIPISVAVEISEAGGAQVQAVLQSAYESGTLRGHKLTVARRVVQQRRKKGKQIRYASPNAGVSAKVTVESLVQAYEEEAARKRTLVESARVAQAQLSFLVEALRTLLADPRFRSLLMAKQLDTMPVRLACHVRPEESDDGVISK